MEAVMVFGDSSSSDHFIVIVPGYMGSLLRDKNTKETIWIDIPAMLRNPAHIDDTLEKLRYPNEDIEPAGIMDKSVLYVLPWAKLDHYGRLIEHLREEGFEINPETPTPGKTAVYPYAYDWRQDNRLSGRQLGETVRDWRQKHNGAKAWLVAHSNGGIISRWFVEKEGGKEDVEHMFLMGSPWDGSPKSVRVLFEGYNIVGRRLLNLFGFNKKISSLIRSFPSFYQLIPYQNPFLRTEDNEVLDLFTNANWLESEQDRQLLQDGLKFNQELGTTLSVHTVCYFGRKKPTTTAGVVSLGVGGKWKEVRWLETGAGDGTIPERSAVHPQAKERHAFAVDHGNIYVHEDVLTQLDFDLAGGLGGLEFVTVTLDNLSLEFDANDDFYTPGETVQVYCTLKDTTPETNPITDARLEVSLVWKEPLPGDEDASPPVQLPEISLKQDANEPGTYRGSLTAPMQEGTYNLRAVVHTNLQSDLTVEEMIAVEAEPGG
jgi:hypothetical protein